MRSYRTLTALIVAAWFVFALSASARNLFRNDAARLGLPVAIAALSPILLFALWFAASSGFRQFAYSLSPRILTLVQTWRIGGFVFITLYTLGILPGIFALPAGGGDMLIGATAPFVALKLTSPDHRRRFIVWQLLGMLDLVTAVTLGTTARLISPHGSNMGAMTVLPLSLIPTFIVPLLFIFHIISIAQARRWRQAESRLGAPVAAASQSAKCTEKQAA